MKKSIISYAMLAFLVIGIATSCKKKTEEQNDYDQSGLAETSSQDDESSVTKEFFYLGSSCNYDFSQISGTCAVVSESSPTFPKTVTIDFGTGCTGPNGFTKKGKIIIEMSNLLTEVGATRSISFENFYVNDVAITGTKTLTNSGLNSDGNLDIVVVSNITMTNSSGSRTKSFNHVREWLGHTTCETSDDEFKITGSGSVTRSGGQARNYKITTPIYINSTCRYPVSGIVDFGTTKVGATLDYGNGSCDEFATLTSKRKGTVKTINLQTRKFE
ncbi:MAG: hypothetical protein WC044_12620 [Crocinitomicaceae bacterium]